MRVLTGPRELARNIGYAWEKPPKTKKPKEVIDVSHERIVYVEVEKEVPPLTFWDVVFILAVLIGIGAVCYFIGFYVGYVTKPAVCAIADGVAYV